jgi:hypothetical protein
MRTTISTVTPLVWASLAFGGNDLQMARIIAVKNYEHGRIAFWEGRVPVFDEFPFYDITLEIGPKTYVVRYESMTGYYPTTWKPGGQIEVRLRDRGTMKVVNDAVEEKVEIINRKTQDCVPPVNGYVRSGPGSLVPCD